MKLLIRKLLVLFCLSGILCMTGCGKNDEEIEYYKANMNQFFDNMAYYDNAINEIDPDGEAAVAELLSILDSMESSFSQMAELVVPGDFIGVEELADEASTYMTEAVSLYHQVLEAEYFNESMADAAKENYDRANLRLQYIISILHGDIPEEIIVMDEDAEEDGEADPGADLEMDVAE